MIWHTYTKRNDYCVCMCVQSLSPTLCDPTDCSTPGSSDLHYLPEFVQSLIHWVGDAIYLILCCLLLLLFQSFPTSGSFPMSQLFSSGGQSIGASGSASVLSMNIQGGLPLGLTGLISLLSKGLSVFRQIQNVISKGWSEGHDVTKSWHLVPSFNGK